MLAKYNIEYVIPFRRNAEVFHYRSDDPVACEEFLSELLERGCSIKAIRHDGVEMPKPDFDNMLKVAAGMMTSRAICVSLGTSKEEAHYRFGFAG